VREIVYKRKSAVELTESAVSMSYEMSRERSGRSDE